MIKIRQAELSDAAAIFTIEQEAHISPWSEKLIAGSFSATHHNYLAELDGEIVGYLFTSLVAGELTLENICVAKKAQGQGIGGLLMKRLVQIADELVCFEIWLEVRASNSSAIALYKKTGFEQQGIRKNYYSKPDSQEKEDAILMKRPVN